MADPSRVEFRHADLNDGFIKYANLVFVLIRSWGVAFFGLMIGAIPAWILLWLVTKPFRAILGTSIDKWVSDWGIGLWLGLSVPIAIYFAWLRWQQLQLNRFSVDAQGIEYLWYPRKLKRIPWSEVQRIRDTEDPEDSASSCELIFETAQGKFKIQSEFWPLGGIYAAVQRHYKVTRDFDRQPTAS